MDTLVTVGPTIVGALATAGPTMAGVAMKQFAVENAGAVGAAAAATGAVLLGPVGATIAIAGIGAAVAYDYFSPGFTAWYSTDDNEYHLLIPPTDGADSIMPPGVYITRHANSWISLEKAYVNCGYQNYRLDSNLNVLDRKNPPNEREIQITDIDTIAEIERDVHNALPVGKTLFPRKDDFGEKNFSNMIHAFSSLQELYVNENSADGREVIGGTATQYADIIGDYTKRFYASVGKGVASASEYLDRAIKVTEKIGKVAVLMGQATATGVAAYSIIAGIFDEITGDVNDSTPTPTPTPSNDVAPVSHPTVEPDSTPPTMPESVQHTSGNSNLPYSADDSKFMPEPDTEQMRMAEITESRKPLTKQDVMTLRGGEDRREDPSKNWKVPGYSGPYDSSTFEPWNPHTRNEAPFQNLTFWKGKERNPLNPKGKSSDVERDIYLMYNESNKSWENVLKTHMPGVRKLGKHLEKYRENEQMNQRASKRKREEGRGNETFDAETKQQYRRRMAGDNSHHTITMINGKKRKKN